MEIDEERLLWEESDHNLIQWEAAVFVHDEWSKKREASKKKKWQWPRDVSQEQWSMFAVATDEIAMDKIEEWAAKPIQDKYDTLIQILTQAGKEVIGGKWIIVKKRKKASPKRTDVQITISRLRKMRTKLRKKLRKSPTDQELLKKVQQLGKEIREKDIREQDQQMAQVSQDMLGKGLDQKKAFFSYVTRKRSDKSIEATMVAGDGKPIIEENELCKELKAHYNEVYNAAPFPEKSSVKEGAIPSLLPEDSDKLLQPIGDQEVWDILASLKTTRKSSGLSNIPQGFLKFAGPQLKTLLAEWVREMWEEEKTPMQIGQSKITLLHKKGPKNRVANYRTLAVGCNICKIYLKILEKRLSSATEHSYLLGDLQNGFRRGRRCQDNLLVLDTLIQLAKARRKPLVMAFLDITKAYDRVDRNLLWKKLEHMGFPEKIIRVLQETYRNPVGKIIFQGVETEWMQMPLGLKQGCVSITLIVRFIPSRPNCKVREYQSRSGTALGVHNGNIKCRKIPGLFFADDIVIPGDPKTVQQILNIIAEYAAKNGIEFAGHKSSVVPFTRKGG